MTTLAQTATIPRTGILLVKCPNCGQRLTPEERAKAVSRRCRLTQAQSDVLQLIISHRETFGVSPTMASLAVVMRISRPTIYEHVHALRDKGAVTLNPHKSRSIVPVE